MQHRPEIDGLRAVAVVPVILFHAGLPAVSGGFVGVDVFFVISGYLITTLLAEDLAQGRFDLWRFYERRARRILPALFVVLAACLPAAWLWLMPGQFKDFAQSLFATTVFASNVFFWTQSGYFDTASELKPLLHTWSLAVEEQFYLAFPLILWALWARPRLLLAVLAGLGLGSFVWSVWPGQDSNAVFYLIQYRAWELLAGSACALILRRRAVFAHPLPGLAGLALIAWPMVAYGADTPVWGWTPLPAVLGTALVILSAAPGTPAARLLSLPPMVGIGLISYSAYLWHQPVLAFARLVPDDPPGLPVLLALSAAVLPLAWITWACVEQPARRGTWRLVATRARVLTGAAAGLVVFGALGLAGHVSDGARTRFVTPDFVAEGQFTIPARETGHCFIGFRRFEREDTDPTSQDCVLGDPAGGNWGIIANAGLLPEVFALIDSALAQDKRVIVMQAPVQLEPAAIERALYRRQPPPVSVDEADTSAAHAAMAARYAGTALEWITRDDMFGAGTRAQRLTPQGYPWSLDGGHLSVYGAEQAALHYLSTRPGAAVPQG